MSGFLVLPFTSFFHVSRECTTAGEKQNTNAKHTAKIKQALEKSKFTHRNVRIVDADV